MDGGDHASQGHGDGQLPLISDHSDQLHQPLKAVSQRRLGQRLKLGALLQDLGQHLHEGRAGLRVTVIPQPCNHMNALLSHYTVHYEYEY